ncbi:MAG: hypothetical protein QY323_04325 [Patescibacteria group bacterium]|nr:MAG: hypothetical protein QY323_04325 [Patescibacteria group bacterium]
MTYPPQDAYREANQGFSKFVVMLLTIGALTALALAVTRYAPAQDAGDLALKLAVTGFVGWLLALVASVYTCKSGGSGNLGLAVVFLFLHIGAIIMCLVFVSNAGTSGGVAMVHQVFQWILMGFQAFFLLLVTYN